jgi:hypothetical protein
LRQAAIQMKCAAAEARFYLAQVEVGAA